MRDSSVSIACGAPEIAEAASPQIDLPPVHRVLGVIIVRIAGPPQNQMVRPLESDQRSGSFHSTRYICQQEVPQSCLSIPLVAERSPNPLPEPELSPSCLELAANFFD